MLKTTMMSRRLFNAVLKQQQQQFFIRINNQKAHLVSQTKPPSSKHELSIAISTGNLNEVRRILQNKASVDVINYRNPDTTLFEKVKNIPTLANGTALHDAVYFNNPEIAKFLIENGAIVNLKDLAHGCTPLMYATIHDKLEMAQILLDRGADVNASDNKGVTALMGAILIDRPKVAKLLIDRGANVNAKDKNNMTCLMHAANTGSVELVGYLLDHGATFSDDELKNALVLAAQNSFVEVIRLFVERGVDLKRLKPDEGMTALMAAALCRNVSVVRYLLLELGVDVSERRTVNHDTALHYAALTPGNLKIVELLLDFKADLNAKCKSGHTPIWVAVIAKQLDVVALLLRRGADVNATLSDGNKSLLMFAAEQGDVAIMRLLLDNGADVKARHSSGKTALIFAVLSQRIEAVECLVERWPDVIIDDNAKPRDSNGRRILNATETALRLGCMDIYRYLTSKGGLATIRDYPSTINSDKTK